MVRSNDDNLDFMACAHCQTDEMPKQRYEAYNTKIFGVFEIVFVAWSSCPLIAIAEQWSMVAGDALVL